MARAIGIVGILGTIALAAFAFAPRSRAIAVRFDALSNRVALPWDPQLAPGPEPAPLDRNVRPSPAIVAEPSGVVPALVTSNDSANVATVDLQAESAAPSASEAVEPGAGVTAPEQAPAPNAAAQPVAQPAAEPVTAPAPRVVSEAAARPRVRSAPREAPAQGFSEAEIQRRKARYEAWLKEQGLERIH